MGANAFYPELDLKTPAAPNTLEEFQRAAALKQAAAQTQGLQQQNQERQLELQDEQKMRSLAPQFVQKDSNGKPTGFDNDGYVNALLGAGVSPAKAKQFQMAQIQMQQGLIGLKNSQIEQHDKINDQLYGISQSIIDENKKGAAESTAPPSPTPAKGPEVPFYLQKPSEVALQGPQAAIPASSSPVPAPGGTLPSPGPQTAPITAPSAVPQARPINARGQAAYRAALPQILQLLGPQAAQQLPARLTDEHELDQFNVGLAQHKQQLADAKTQGETQEAVGKGAQAQAAAEKDEWLGSDGIFVNRKTGQVIHAGGSPSLQAFQEYISRGGNPLNFASDQAAREAANPALQAAKLHDATALKAAEQAITDGDPRAAAKLLIDGTVAPSQIISSRKPAFAQQAFSAAAEMQPGWNATKADADFNVAKSSQNLGFFGSAKSLTDKGGTLDQLKAAAKDIPENQFPVFNSVADWYKAATGSGPIAKYAALALGVADDYSKVMGGGQGSDTSRVQALNIIAAKQSPEQRDASLEGIRGAVNSQKNSRIGNNPVLQKMYGDAAAAPANDFFSQYGGQKR